MEPLPDQLAAAALDQLADGAVLAEAGPPPRIIGVNRALEAMVGYTAEEVRGATPCPFRAADGDPGRERLQQRLTEGHSARAEFTGQHRDGTPLRIACTGSPIRDARGQVTHYLLVYRNLAEEAEASTRIRQLEALIRIQADLTEGNPGLEALRQRVVDAALDLTNAEGAVLEEVRDEHLIHRAVAGTAADQAGLEVPMEGSLSGLAYARGSSLLVTDTLDDERLAPALREQFRDLGFRSGVLVPLTHTDRTWGVLKVYAATPGQFSDAECRLLELASGALAASLRRVRDHAEERERRGLLLDAVPAFIAYIDTDQRYREVNAAYRERFGVTSEELRGRSVADFLGQEAYDRIRPYLEAALAGERVSNEDNLPLPDGTTRPLHGDYIPHRDEGGQVRGLYAIIRDITDHRDARIDYLTGLLNRREFENQGQRLLSIAQRYQHDLTLIMGDIDHFKAVNDDLGHLVGDTVLQGIADALRAELREADLAGRWGGEEFVLVLPETGGEPARSLAERLRRAVAERELVSGRTITMSFGLAAAAPGDSLRSLQSRADRALYRAKQRGRNRMESDSGELDSDSLD